MDNRLDDSTRVGAFQPRSRTHDRLLLLGIGLLVLGVLSILAPLAASLAATIIIGVALAVSGVIRFVHSFEERQSPGFAWHLLSSIIYFAAGVVLLANPLAGMFTLTLVLGILFVISGFLKFVRSLQLRSVPGWGFIMFDGIVTFVLGVILWAGLPGTALWALGIIVGVDLVVGGAALLGGAGRPRAMLSA
jgi:uncharacterized membrane protein HdeD (DUF308 family)